MTSANSQI